ncbi:MurR/RpiR family transcriptional regulator [Pseudomonas sp. RIT-PI-S]|uniref:MurR/RpiR family transcriptional regulator n=1 Tax=Pseudomonas sp. RIT-PI-S TaxID=3035295 RepID=UPI0021D97FDE|nr:MurR/RpiR family transcriptional regulator [Pseudomonas sp. RIT-PI-S]
MDVLYKLRTQQGDFSAGEGRIARLILDDVAWAAAASLDDLAERAEVSGATLSRFARRVGCKDLRDLRLQLAQAGGVGARFLEEAEQPPSAFFGQIVADIETTLRQHLAGFDEASFKAVAECLASAEMIHAFGMGGASSLCASELQVRLVRLGLPIAACHDPILMRVTAATLGPRQALMLFSLSGHNPDLLPVARLARDYGVPVLAVTAPGSPLAALATLTLPLVQAETDFIFKPTAARYGMLLAVDLLATELALRAPARSREHLRRIKLALDEHRGGGDRQPLGD